MKKKICLVLAVLLCLSLLAGCGKKAADEGDLWGTALYAADTELGSGAKTVNVKVSAGDKSVMFTLHTDAGTVGEALLEAGIAEGEDSSYGFYIKSVNGIVADYDVDQTYWAFYVNGEYAMSGVDTTGIDEAAEYSLERAK